MPTRRLLACTLIALSLPLAASAATITEQREVSGFSAISLRGSIDLVVRQGAREAVEVRAEDKVVPQVHTTVEGSGDERTLRIEVKPTGGWLRTTGPIVVTVDVVRLSAVSAAGSGHVTIGALKTPSLALSVSGSSDAKLDQLDAERLKLAISGSGNVNARGKAARLDVSIAGSGDVKAQELAADDVNISIAGSGDARVTAAKTIGVSIAGSGDVEYGGGAALTKSSIAGSGSVRQRR